MTDKKWSNLKTRNCPYCESKMGLIALFCGECGKRSYPY
jgi:predicted amidophosphoribosyltransferase